MPLWAALVLSLLLCAVGLSAWLEPRLGVAEAVREAVAAVSKARLTASRSEDAGNAHNRHSAPPSV